MNINVANNEVFFAKLSMEMEICKHNIILFVTAFVYEPYSVILLIYDYGWFENLLNRTSLKSPLLYCLLCYIFYVCIVYTYIPNNVPSAQEMIDVGVQENLANISIIIINKKKFSSSKVWFSFFAPQDL